MPIKQMFEYTDIDGVNTTRTVMFNLTQFEVEGEMELEVIQSRFQKFQDEVVGTDPDAPIREMTGPEKREILGMIKTLIKHSYGVRDGKRFIKSQEVWDEFEQTGAFSAFLYWLFSDARRVNSFMDGIWPQGLDRPEDEPRPDLKVVQDNQETTDVVQGEVIDNSPSIDDADWHFANFTREQLLAMSEDDFQKVGEASRQGRNVPQPLLQIAGQRKSQAGGQTD